MRNSTPKTLKIEAIQLYALRDYIQQLEQSIILLNVLIHHTNLEFIEDCGLKELLKLAEHSIQNTLNNSIECLDFIEGSQLGREDE